MTTSAATPQPHPVRAGSPRFRGVWNGRPEPATSAEPAERRSGAIPSATRVVVRRGTVAPVLPGRAAIGVLGAPSRVRRPGQAG